MPYFTLERSFLEKVYLKNVFVKWLLYYALLFINFELSVIVSPLLVYFMAIIMENVIQGWQNFFFVFITGQFHILIILMVLLFLY